MDEQKTNPIVSDLVGAGMLILGIIALIDSQGIRDTKLVEYLIAAVLIAVGFVLVVRRHPKRNDQPPDAP